MRTRVTTHTLLLVLLVACSQPMQEPEQPDSSEASSGAERGPVDGTFASPALEPAAEAPPPSPEPSDSGFVFVNGVGLTAPDVAELQAVLGSTPKPGRYWYDGKSGLWGLEGHGAGGVTRPGLLTSLSPLSKDASAGTSGAFVNGRQLPAAELTAIATLLEWPQPADSRYAGHYTLDADGALNSAKGRYLGNVAAAAKREAGAEAPGLTRCIWYHLHEPDEVFGHEVTLACD